ncbi:hypothetical protein H8356DRAFT_1036152 [Neocallimastix lanati (nom. inval.)]|uniref:Uncharacterized protein n=1 Tax=Neocallimastix californiae TaxID=1754190 RepID=A0A1Y2BUT9_9FUNG|nr:hypothetical protein H8356DRAFT_1036152 [Neocallimastix sp. JGI-2020a]ORY37875.1 hypothetical protein LY90DRAFT_511106 [Neocallimastix californiae]|eukprot:ORY37875.1 hypothetical protein LY90DRAFT_511106 [Neocallimastix californiae]
MEKRYRKLGMKLISTGKYILDNERKDGNENLIGYNGLFADRKSGIMSALEFIHSFRKTKDSPYPKYTDQEAVDALYKIKFANPIYNKTVLVGNREGVSASCLEGTNIGINKYISDERKKATVKVLKFITSYDIQKSLVINSKVGSGINALYDDDEVCQAKHLVEFIYEDRDAVEVLNAMIDITRIYDISMNYSEIWRSKKLEMFNLDIYSNTL